MANVKISGLPAVTSVATTDVIPVVTGGVTSKIGSANFVNSGLSGGTANGVLYLNGSKAATSGSALTFDGTNLGIGTTSPYALLNPNTSSRNATAAWLTAPLFNNGGAPYSDYVELKLGNSYIGLNTIGQASIRAYANVWSDSGSKLAFLTSTSSGTLTEAMTLDASGNLGLGVTPSAWGSTFPSIQIGNGGAITARNVKYNEVYLGANAYHDGSTGWRYIATDYATNYYQYDGKHVWRTAPSWNGTGSNVISFTQAMTLSSDGTFRVKGAGTAGSTDAVQFSGSAPASSMSLDSYGNLHIPGGGGISTNEAFGTGALRSNTTGDSNTAIGVSALYYNTTGSGNTASGVSALQTNTTGSYNTASGLRALYSNTAGSYNTASGFYALNLNITGNSNTASGSYALRNSGKTVTAGSFVIGVTYTIQSIGTTDFTLIGAASNTIGVVFTTTGVGTGTGTASSNTDDNSAFGYQALYSNTTGISNTAIGLNALYYNTTGRSNTAIGLNALYNNATGSGNVMIGGLNSANTYVPVFDPTTENNRFCMGSTSVTNAYIQVAWTVVSDLRDKLLLGDVPHGLDFVTKLKPIKYQFKESRDSDIGHGPIKYGFGAQDVLALEGNDAVIVDTEVEDKLKITDSHLVPVLVKAIQELKAELDELKSQLGK